MNVRERKRYIFTCIHTLGLMEDLFQKFGWPCNIISVSLLVFVPEELISFMNETKLFPNLKRKLKSTVMM